MFALTAPLHHVLSKDIHRMELLTHLAIHDSEQYTVVHVLYAKASQLTRGGLASRACRAPSNFWALFRTIMVRGAF